MKIAMIRVGVDAGAKAGGIQGPLFKDGSFEYIPVPETPGFASKHTYGNLMGRHGQPLVNYFPPGRQSEMSNRTVHYDPEWDTFTYGDYTGGPKAGLKDLDKGDILIFTCGLCGWGGFHSEPGIYLTGYFIVEAAGTLSQFTRREEKTLFKNNAHVRLLKGKRVTYADGTELILVKGSSKSRLLKKAVLLSTTAQDSIGRTLKVISPKMQRKFGDFGGRISIQRSPTRWVDPAFTKKVANYLQSLK